VLALLLPRLLSVFDLLLVLESIYIKHLGHSIFLLYSRNCRLSVTALALDSGNCERLNYRIAFVF
jgi:hypothetical protein